MTTAEIILGESLRFMASIVLGVLLLAAILSIPYQASKAKKEEGRGTDSSPRM